MIYKQIERETLRPLLGFGLMVVGLTVVGTIGYMVLEGWRFLDAIYMVVITLSTVGFGEVQPLSGGGQVFTVVLILAGVGAVGYFIGNVGQHIISGALTGTFWSRRMQRNIDQLTGHHVVCGYGRVGRQVVENLGRRGQEVVVVEQDASQLSEPGHPFPYVLGDASDDETLRRSGIERASGLVVATGDDAVNLFVTLSARALNEQITIIARANVPPTEPKLRRAGATHVISPYAIAGNRISTQLLHPQVTAFLDEVMHSPNLELWLEDIRIAPSSELDGKTVEDMAAQARTGANVIAIRGSGREGSVTADLQGVKVNSHDILIALGTREQLKALSELASGGLP